MEGAVEKKWYEMWWSQFKLLLWKNWKIMLRNRRSTIVQLAAPAFFVITLFFLEIAVRQDERYAGDLYNIVRTQKPYKVPDIPPCVQGPDTDFCYTFVYAPDTPDVKEIIDLIRTQNNPTIPEDKVRAFDSEDEVDSFLFDHMNTTQASVIFEFDILNSNDSNVPLLRNVTYTVQVNQTDQYSHGVPIRMTDSVGIPLQYAAERALLQWLNRQTTFLNTMHNVSLVKFPHPEVLTTNIIGENGPLWFFAALMFNFVVGLGNIVSEKENKLRAIMKLMGLYDSVYWVTWFITLSVFSTATVFVLIITGAIFQFNFFLKNAFGLYFFLMEFFALSLVSLTFLISTFVRKAAQATGVGFLVFILGFFLLLGGTIVFSVNADNWIRLIFSFFSPTPFSVGLGYLGSATEKEAYPGLSWSEVDNKEVVRGGVISFNQMYGWLILDFFIYLLLALYFDNVIKDQYGTRRPYYYFLMPSYWTGRAKPVSETKGRPKTLAKTESMTLLEVNDEDVIQETKAVREDNLPKNTAVKVQDLTKIYRGERTGCCSCLKAKPKDFYAVNDLNLSIESDTLLCLLGPNGAGKTTTIHMLVGFHEATSGDAVVFGNSIRNNITEVQKVMGVCPQFDILWNELTGEEHLQLFAGLKNIDPVNIEKEVNRLLKEVSLEDSRKVRSVSYSGGMRRRLSVAISLIGNPKIVFLDEPTTGMDPVSRRQVWNIIEKAKKNKVIVLTTHSMEEADILGDKIAIMAQGRLQCVGSSLHLKQKFGAGYRITIGAEENMVDKVIKFVNDNLEGAKLVSQPQSGYMGFTLSRDGTKDLIPFFRKLEGESKKLSLRDVQLSLTTLEEVFLTIAENAELRKIQASIKQQFEDEHKESMGEIDSNGVEMKDMNQTDVENGGVRRKKDKFSRRDQFKALFIKTARLQSRDKKTNICQCLTPFFLVLLLFLFQVLVDYIIDADPVDEVIYQNATQPFHLLSQIYFDGEQCRPEAVGFTQVCPNAFVEDVVLPLYLQGSKILYSSNGVDTELGDYALGTGIFGKVTPVFNETFDHKFQVFNPFGQLTSWTFDLPNWPIRFNFYKYNDKEAIEKYVYDSWDDGQIRIVGGYSFEELDFTNNEFSWFVYFNHTLTFGEDVPFLMNRMTNAIAQLMDEPAIVKLKGIKEMPTLAKDKIFELDLPSLAGAFFYMLVLLQLMPVFLANIVYEKESKIKEIMSMMGLKMNIYWVVHYVFDFFVYFIVMMMLIIAGLIFQFRVFTTNTFLSYFLLFFFWGHVLIAISFVLSTLFSSRRTALIVGYFLVLGIALLCNAVLESVFGDIFGVSAVKRSLLSCVPFFALYRGLVYLTAEVSWSGPGYSISSMNLDVVNIGEVYGFLIVEWCVLMILWLYLEQVVPSGWGVKKHPLFFLGYGKHLESEETLDESVDTSDMPEDVSKEQKAVFKKKAKKRYQVLVKNIKKVYPSVDGNPPKTAVKGVSFGVKKNSCMGILGHNGAGKTTLIHMLIGLFDSTSGTAYICKKNLKNDLEEIHTFMGICPQHDVLWENLTGREHLEFYGRIKGLRGDELKKEVARGLKAVNLWDARNKLSRKYSGGMKRRLSVAIAILGQPKVIFLDEPSTGLDPKSRQDLWKVINDAKKNSSIVLTTHSMEEADAICDRIMIMADGEVKCLGVSADLKHRFGEGFKVSVQVAKHEDDKPVDDFVKEHLPGAVLINELAGSRNYQVGKDEVKLHEVFELFETNKERLHITDWAITNTTLEEVFLRISLANENKGSSEESQSDEDSDQSSEASGRGKKEAKDSESEEEKKKESSSEGSEKEESGSEESEGEEEEEEEEDRESGKEESSSEEDK